MAIELWRTRWGLKRDPFRELSRLEREMEDLLSRPFRGWPRLGAGVESLDRTPAIDVIDRKDEVAVRADLPGPGVYRPGILQERL